MFVDICLKFYAVPSQVTLRPRSWVIDFDRFSGKAQVRRATLSCDSSYFKQELTDTKAAQPLEIPECETTSLSIWSKTKTLVEPQWAKQLDFAYSKPKTQISFVVTLQLVSPFVNATRNSAILFKGPEGRWFKYLPHFVCQ